MLMGKHEQHQPPMKIYGKVLLILAVFFAATFTVILSPAPTSAATSTTVCKCTNTYQDGNDTYTKDEDGSDIMLFGDDNGCFCGGTLSIVRMGMNIAMAGIAVLGTIGIIWAGVMWLTAGDNAGQIAMAKKRMLQVVVGLAAFGMIDVVGNMLLPGGIASSAPTLVSSSSTRVSGVDLVIDPPASNTTSSVTAAPSVDDTPSTPSSNSTSSGSNSDSTSVAPLPATKGSCPSGKSGRKYYKQYSYTDLKWKDGNCNKKKCGCNYSVACSGCPMIAALNAINKTLDCNYTPNDFAGYMKRKTNNWNSRAGLFKTNGEWSNLGENIIRYYVEDVAGLHLSKKISSSQVVGYIKQGRAVIGNGRRGSCSATVFSINGHYVMYSGMSGGKVIVENPAQSANGRTVTPEQAVCGGNNFWVVY